MKLISVDKEEYFRVRRKTLTVVGYEYVVILGEGIADWQLFDKYDKLIYILERFPHEPYFKAFKVQK